MPLSYNEISLIVNSVHKIFGYYSKVYLFGSRIDDNKKGGDIDLYIELENSLGNKKYYKRDTINKEMV